MSEIGTEGHTAILLLLVLPKIPSTGRSFHRADDERPRMQVQTSTVPFGSCKASLAAGRYVAVSTLNVWSFMSLRHEGTAITLHLY